MGPIKFVITDFDHLSETLFFMAHHRTETILGLFSSERQKYFYDFAITNLKYTNIECLSFSELAQKPQQSVNKVSIIMDIPTTFQTMSQLIKQCQHSTQTIIVLMRSNKKYVNMFKKKVLEGKDNIQTAVCQISKSDYVGINRKFRDLVDQSYDMNRAAFYAYGAYLNNFRANLLKFIFKTEAIDVAALAKSFGFNTPPRVKEGNFLKVEVRKEQIREKLKEKKLKKKQVSQNSPQLEGKAQKKLTSLQRIKALAAKKTKIIMKSKQQIAKPKQNIAVSPSETPQAPVKQKSGKITVNVLKKAKIASK